MTQVSSDSDITAQNSAAHLVFLTNNGQVISLFLSDRPGLIGTGITFDFSSIRDILHNVHIEVDEDVILEIEDNLSSIDMTTPTQFLASISDHPDLEIMLLQPDENKKIWVGIIKNTENGEALRFNYEEYDSPDVITIIVCAWVLWCSINVIRDLIKTCEDKAENMCGAGNVKVATTVKRWTLKGCAMDCHIECK